MLNVSVAAPLPDVGLTLSQVDVGVPTVQVRPLPPLLLSVMVCGVGLVPAVVVKFSVFVLSCMEAGGVEIAIFTEAGLPDTALFVIGSVALIVTLAEAFVPPGTLVVSTETDTLVLAPAARVPEAVEEIVT